MVLYSLAHAWQVYLFVSRQRSLHRQAPSSRESKPHETRELLGIKEGPLVRICLLDS
jgi:hypothetical protein